MYHFYFFVCHCFLYSVLMHRKVEKLGGLASAAVASFIELSRFSGLLGSLSFTHSDINEMEDRIFICKKAISINNELDRRWLASAAGYAVGFIEVAQEAYKDDRLTYVQEKLTGLVKMISSQFPLISLNKLRDKRIHYRTRLSDTTWGRFIEGIKSNSNVQGYDRQKMVRHVVETTRSNDLE